jgi:hypothetical protein
MKVSTILELIRKRPFEPLRVTMSSGEQYEIRHPEFVVPLASGLFVSFPSKSEGKVQPTDDFAILSYLHITSFDTIKSKSRRRAS